jgi:hypothetical protein
VGSSIAKWLGCCLLETHGDTDGARVAYQQAINNGPRDVSELAASALRELDGTQSSD